MKKFFFTLPLLVLLASCVSRMVVPAGSSDDSVLAGQNFEVLGIVSTELAPQQTIIDPTQENKTLLPRDVLLAKAKETYPNADDVVGLNYYQDISSTSGLFFNREEVKWIVEGRAIRYRRA